MIPSSDSSLYLVKNAMEIVINMLLDICVHLHLATCHQGYSLHRYEDLVKDERKKTKFVISGWTMALFQESTHNKDELIHYIAVGCPHFSYRHRYNKKYYAYVSNTITA